MSLMPAISPEEILPLSGQHNFWMWSARARARPIPAHRAQGVYFRDVAGWRYLDFNSMVMCSSIGTATKSRILLGQLLAEITLGDLNHFLHTSGCAEANENAVQSARAHTGRHKILSPYHSYHRATYGAVAATSDPRRWVLTLIYPMLSYENMSLTFVQA